MTISIDAELCVANAMCVAIAPDIFELAPGAAVSVVKLSVTDDVELMELAREAEESCPREAILLGP